MNKPRKTPRSTTAMLMITMGTGKKQIFKDRRLKRNKDAKNSWQKEWNIR